MPHIKIPLKTMINVTKIVTLYYFEYSSDFKSSGESHDFWEIVYVDRGELDLRGGEVTHRLGQGEMIFHRPNEFHSISGDGSHSASAFIITFECRSAAMRFFYGKTVRVPKELRGLLDSLVEECTRNFRISSYPLKMNEDAPVGGLQMIQNYLECFLISLMRHEADRRGAGNIFATSQQTFESDLASDMVAWLRENVYNKITLEDLAGHFHFSISTLCSVFKRSTGQSIMKYFTRLKIEESMRLMRETSDSISRILERLGFDSQQHFSRTFRRYAGVSPRAFRNSVIKSLTVDTLKG